jgi:hypothetical protein
MFSLEDLLGKQQGTQAVDQISQMLGANPTTTNSAIQIALPLILSGLARNASQPNGAESLDNALEQDHNGGILDNLGLLLEQNQQTPQTDGLGILGHIFGQKQGAVAQEVSQNTGLDIGQGAKLLMMLAPIVMGYLGKQKQQNNLGADGLSNLLQEKQQQIQSSDNPMMDIVTNFFDKNQDGSAMDDLASMASNYFSRR